MSPHIFLLEDVSHTVLHVRQSELGQDKGNFKSTPTAELKRIVRNLHYSLLPEEQRGSWYSFRGNLQPYPTAKSLSTNHKLSVLMKLFIGWVFFFFLRNSLQPGEKILVQKKKIFFLFLSSQKYSEVAHTEWGSSPNCSNQLPLEFTHNPLWSGKMQMHFIAGQVWHLGPHVP